MTTNQDKFNTFLNIIEQCDIKFDLTKFSPQATDELFKLLDTVGDAFFDLQEERNDWESQTGELEEKVGELQDEIDAGGEEID